MAEPGADPSAPVGLVIAIGSDTDDRIETVSRFWSALQKNKPREDPRATPQRRHRLRQMLRAIDAWMEAVPYRRIAAVLFPDDDIEARSWVGNPVRETTIRLVRDGKSLVNGGYRALLRRSRRS